MTDTVNLGLPCIEGNQAQKHVTHNEALRILDTLVQLAVLDRDIAAPPGSPVEGERWIVRASATGAWAGHDNEIAAWQDGAWQFSPPRTGWLAYAVDECVLLAWDGGAWVSAIDALTPTVLNNMTLLGVGTSADATNPFSTKLNSTLFTAKTEADGGDGNLRYKLNKENAAKTLSLLFQDNFSGRAEIGLTGDDDFHFKVSPDGTAWTDAIVIDKSTGLVTLSQGFANPPAPFDAMTCTNIALNGDHIVSQENCDSAVTAIGSSGGIETYITDQWKIRAKGSLRVSGQRITSISLPGIKYALRTTITTAQSSLGSGDYLQISQPIEGLRAFKLALGNVAAFPVALGFYVRSSVTGTFAAELTNSARDRSICKIFTIGAANTWTWVPFAGAPHAGRSAFPGDNSGTWLNDTGVGLRVGITLAAGPLLQGTADAWSGADVLTTSAQTNLAATSSATFDVTGLCAFGGIELPPSARPALAMRSFDAEFPLCERYFRKSYDPDTVPGSATRSGLVGGLSFDTATSYGIPVTWPIPLRALASYSTWDGAGNAGKNSYYDGGGWHDNNTGVSIIENGLRGFVFRQTANSAQTFHYVADARMS
jgi:hypothetical protein